MAIDFSKIRLRNNREKKRFELHANGTFAFIKYEEKGKVMNLTSTEAPMELRGTGTAKAMVEKTFKYLQRKGYKIETECSYIDLYFNRNPQWEKMKAKTYVAPESDKK